jgi:hypothetical protein
MNDLLDGFTKKLLDHYNRELREKRQETWLLCLLTHLILCMCAEQVQAQVDSFIVFRIQDGACDPIALRNCGTEVCRRVEHVVLEHSWILLRGKLKALLRKRNPFKYMYQVGEGEVLKETELNLVNEIRQVMSDHGKCFPEHGDVFADVIQRARYSKRLSTRTTAAVLECQMIPISFEKATQVDYCRNSSGGFY